MEYIIFSTIGVIVAKGAYITGKTHGKLEAFNEINEYKTPPRFETLEDVVHFVDIQIRKVH